VYETTTGRNVLSLPSAVALRLGSFAFSPDSRRLSVGTGEGSLKVKTSRRDPRVALSIVDVKDPYTEAQLRGRVVEFRPDRAFAVKDVTARKYTGKEFPWRNPEGQVALVIEVDRAKFAKLPFTHAPAGGAR